MDIPNAITPNPIRPKKGTATPTERTKRLQAALLRARRDNADLNYQQLGDMFGITRTYARKLLLKALRDIIQEPAEEVIQLELARLDYLQTEVIKVLQSFHVVVSQGCVVRDVVEDEHGQPIVDINTGQPRTKRIEDTGPKLAAVDRALKIMERRSRFLGLDKVPNPDKEGLTVEEFAAKILKTVNQIDKATGTLTLFPDDPPVE